MTKQDLITVCQEQALRRCAELAVGTSNERLAQEIGMSVRDTYLRLRSMGALPLGLPAAFREVNVDYNRYVSTPEFVVTVRF